MNKEVKYYYYLSLMKFEEEVRFGLELSLYDMKDLENGYKYLIPISSEEFNYLCKKFYNR